MKKIKQELMNELIHTLKENCREEVIPEELRGAPDVPVVWNAQWAEFDLENIAKELVEDMMVVLQKHTLEVFIKEEDGED